MDSMYKCIQSFEVQRVNDEGFEVENECFHIKKGSKWYLRGCAEGWDEYDLRNEDATTGELITINKATLDGYFEPINNSFGRVNEMKIVSSDKYLIGKKIVFSHMSAFAENITLATEDGCVLVVRQLYDEDTDESQIIVLNEIRALRYIEGNEHIRHSLGELGIFDIENYRQKKEEEIRKRLEEFEAKKLKEERELYEKLKAKFEKA